MQFVYRAVISLIVSVTRRNLYLGCEAATDLKKKFFGYWTIRPNRKVGDTTITRVTAACSAFAVS